MASKSSRRRKRAARRGPAERTSSTGASGVPDHATDDEAAVVATTASVGLMARAQSLIARVTAPVSVSSSADTPTSNGNHHAADSDHHNADSAVIDSDSAAAGGALDTIDGGPVEIVAGSESVTDTTTDDDTDAPSGRRWGLGDAIGGWAIAQVASVLAIAAVVTSLGYPKVVGVGAAVGQAVGQTQVNVTLELLNVWGQLPIEWQVLLQVPLWLGLIGAPVYAARRKGTSLREDFGLSVVRTDIPVGLVIGVACQLVLVPLVYLPFRLMGSDTSEVSEPAQELVASAVSPLGVVLLLLIVGAGAPFAEELFYRGLVQRSLLNRLGRPAWAIVLSAMFFAFAHMQSLQFPALVVVGVVFGVLAWRSGRLGLSIFAHVGFNLTTAVVFLFDLTLPFS